MTLIFFKWRICEDTKVTWEVERRNDQRRGEVLILKYSVNFRICEVLAKNPNTMSDSNQTTVITTEPDLNPNKNSKAGWGGGVGGWFLSSLLITFFFPEKY